MTRTVYRDTEGRLVQEASNQVICQKGTKRAGRSKSKVVSPNKEQARLARLPGEVFEMARKVKTQASTKHHTKRNKSKESIVGYKRANAAGFQKRIKGNRAKSMDVYDFDDNVNGKRKRAHVSTDLTKEEKRELGGDHDELEPDEIERVRRQLQSGEDGIILSEDDEDIDSDEAFDASDEETFGAFKLKVRHTECYGITVTYSFIR